MHRICTLGIYLSGFVGDRVVRSNLMYSVAWVLPIYGTCGFGLGWFSVRVWDCVIGMVVLFIILQLSTVIILYPETRILLRSKHVPP